MTARVWPVDAVSGAPSYTGRALRQTTVAPFVAMGTSARPLGAKSGVRIGTPSSTVAATSTTWTVTPFAGVIDGESAAIAGPYAYAFDANVTGSVTAAGASARVDRLDVQISDPAESDGSSTPSIAIVYTAGTPGLAAAPARSHALAQINVPATGGGSPTVSWAPAWCGDPGEWTFNTVAERDAYVTAIGSANVPPLQQAFIIGTGVGYVWSGSAWSVSSPLRVALTKNIAQNGNASTETKITWSTVAATIDVGGFYSTSNNTRLTAPVTGSYLMVFQVGTGDSATGRTVTLLKNGTHASNISAAQNSTLAPFVSGQVITPLSAGDYIELGVIDTGSATNIATGLVTNIYMELLG